MKLVTNYLQKQRSLHPETVNWQENFINDSLYYSYRSTEYDRNSYPSYLHYHDYYELVVYIEGDISYICESSIYTPKPGDVILIPHQAAHMSKPDTEHTVYTRHVFYLYPDALDSIGGRALVGFLKDKMTIFRCKNSDGLLSLLSQLENALRRGDDIHTALALGYILQIFYQIGQREVHAFTQNNTLPNNVKAIRQYINNHFIEIESVSDIAEHFFYSREYLSRLFKKHFNTTVAEYIASTKVATARTLLSKGSTVTEACYAVGFKTHSSFIRAFTKQTGMTPSQYRKSLFNETF